MKFSACDGEACVSIEIHAVRPELVAPNHDKLVAMDKWAHSKVQEWLDHPRREPNEA
jgi:hypothetical protein